MASLDYQPGQLLPGTVYRVLRLIGVGGMGTVYDVEDTSIGKRYVVKTLHPKLGAREDLARRVMKEARTLARLNHPNIIEVITAGVTADDYKLPYYVMERLNGQSLRMVIDKKGRLELSHAYHIGIDLLDALDHAHDKGLIHRDVKPDNIFLHRTPGGVTITKLLDFGIVSVLDSAAGSSETAGRFLGTLRYAAPEQLRGESPTPKMDVYAAALVIYEIAAGCGPFDDQGDTAAVGAAHMNKLAPRLSQHVPVPKELDNLIAAALAKDPRQRPRDAFSFAASLRNMSRSLEAAGRADTTGGRTTVAGVMGLVTDSSPSPVALVAPMPAGGPVTPASPPVAAVAATPTLEPARASSAPRPALGNATLIGMPAPTAGPGDPLDPGVSVTTTTPEAVDRMAATRSIDTDVAHVARNGTEAVAMPAQESLPSDVTDDGATVPCGPPSEVGEHSIEWPAPRARVLSDEPQVRSVPSAAPRPPRGPMVAAGAGAAILVLLAAVAVSRRTPGGTSAGQAETMVERVTRPPTRPVEPEIIPAPTIAPPAFEPGELPDTRPSNTPRVSAVQAGGPASVEAVVPPAGVLSSATGGTSPRLPPRGPAVPAPAKAPSATHFAADRPGPGF
jgi:tRNA A-37 threonylcarbamoyl transferase component Bud32